MAETEIHVITMRELRTDPRWDRWEDPTSIAPISAEKKTALLTNPLAGEDDDPVQLLGTVDGHVAGRLDLVAGAFEVDGESVRCEWGSGFYVPEEYRQTLLGVKLVLAAQRLHDTIGASGSSRTASALYRNLRWSTFELPRFVLVRRSRPVVERYVGATRVGRSTRVVADAALAAHGAMLGAWIRRRTRPFGAEQVAEFPAALATAVPVSSRAVAGHRSPAWINWLLRSTFDEPPSRRGLFSVVGPGGDVVGYFLIRARTYATATQRDLRDIHLGSLQDWASFDPALRFEHIALLAVREFFRWGVDAVEVCVPDDEAAAGLRKLGFVRIGSMFIQVNAGRESPLSAPRFRDPQAWRLRPAEGDNFFS